MSKRVSEIRVGKGIHFVHCRASYREVLLPEWINSSVSFPRERRMPVDHHREEAHPDRLEEDRAGWDEYSALPCGFTFPLRNCVGRIGVVYAPRIRRWRGCMEFRAWLIRRPDDKVPVVMIRERDKQYPSDHSEK